MGRFSPSIQPGPSWTQGLEQGAQNFAQQLIQNRQYNLQKKKEVFDENIQTQNEARENAQAGYTPAQPYGASTANTPEGLDRISNAGVSDAGLPAQYDPYASGAAAIYGIKNEGMWDRAALAAKTREDVANIGAAGRMDVTKYRLGNFGPDGSYIPGAAASSYTSEHAPAVAAKAAQVSAAQAETARHHRAEELYPRGVRSGGTGAASASPNGLTVGQQSALSRGIASDMKMQHVPGRPNADGTSFAPRVAPGLSLEMATGKNIGILNQGLSAAGKDTVPNANGAAWAASQRAKVSPSSVAPHVEKDGTAATNAPAPVQGLAQPKTSNGLADQHVRTSAPQITSSPTQPIGAAAKPKLSASDAAKAKSDPGFASFLEKKYNLKSGVDY